MAPRRVLGWRRHGWLIAWAILGYGLDLTTKELALHHLVPGEPHEFLGGWLQLQLLFNPGAAFSLGENFTVVFACLGLVALLMLVIFVAPRANGRFENIVVGLLIAGVGGNLTDRIARPPALFHGQVVDFIGIRYFAVFNIADMCITTAAVMIIVTLLRMRPRRL